ncbi:MAG TPA: efflux RND transporter periplasmic adaptor subunit [Gammaproteobacteria bacterium]|nr:efflux RND transporter periplasmic adaptor subunit [Gammaproteobacteria bacterium]
MKLFRLACVSFLLAAACSALAAPTTAVKVEKVRKQTLQDTATAYGQLAPSPSGVEWLSAAQGGRVAAVLVTRGSRVKKGEALVKIMATPQTQANYQSALSALASARSKLAQTRRLEKGGLATRADLASAKSAFDSARARVDALKAEGVGPHAQTLKAAHAGVVTQLKVSRGEWVSAGARIASLAPRNALWVRFGLTPEQAAAVKPHAAVTITPVFNTGHELKSHVMTVDAQADAATGLIDAEVPVTAGKNGPFTGEWVTGTITLHTVKAVTVKRSAVLKDSKGYYVFLVRHGTAHRVAVKPLIRTGGLVGVKGLTAGDTVVIQGNFELSDGSAVRIEGKKGSGS